MVGQPAWLIAGETVELDRAILLSFRVAEMKGNLYVKTLGKMILGSGVLIGPNEKRRIGYEAGVLVSFR